MVLDRLRHRGVDVAMDVSWDARPSRGLHVRVDEQFRRCPFSGIIRLEHLLLLPNFRFWRKPCAT